MYRIPHSRLGRIALVASGAMLLAGGAFAQSVQVFDDAPTIEQLRSIMIPESKPGVGRTIVIQRPDTGALSNDVRPVATGAMPAPRPAMGKVGRPSQPVQTAAVSEAAPAPQPEAKPSPAADAGVVAFRINFGFNSATLPDSAMPMMDKIAQLMKEAPEIKIRVEGHTDAVGSADYNVSLSERRALSVGEYLAKQGVEPSRLFLIGKGMAEPLTHNGYDPVNRRVQFVRIA